MNSIVGYIIAELVRFFKKKLKIYRAERDDMLAIGEKTHRLKNFVYTACKKCEKVL